MYGTQAEKDLAKLQRKAKNVVDDWLEHYRIAIGLTSPSLNGLRDMPSSRRRYSQSAKLSNTDFLSRGTMLGVDFSKKSSSKLLRAPSAPSGQTKSNRPSTCNNLSLDHQGTLSSLNEITERVVAGGDSETVSPSTLAVMNRLISA
ncbi:hypothetical protein SNE40_014174 [Patella caerulea]|uniref:Uncharacterized protein n=1 Tax=Patella caerulea TaxID=87958 RepID=A0AAN8PCB1_PATCE